MKTRFLMALIMALSIAGPSLAAQGTGGSVIGVTGGSCPAGEMVTSVNSSGVPTCSQKTDKFVFGSGPVLTTANWTPGVAPATVPESVPTNCANTQGVAVTAPTADTTFTLNKVASTGTVTAIGTVKFAAAAHALTIISCTATSLAAGDGMEIVGPASNDATLAGWGVAVSTNAGGL